MSIPYVSREEDAVTGHEYSQKNPVLSNSTEKSVLLGHTGREIYVSKSNGLAYSRKEIHASNLQKVFTETRLEDVKPRAIDCADTL